MKTEWADETAIPDVKPPPHVPQKKATARDGEEPPPPPPKLLNFYDIPLPPADDPNELLKFRFLCRGGGLLVVGNTGIGKSSFVIQCAVLWSIGREAFGIKPRGPLRVLILQAENDEGDMAEFREGILAGLGITDEERRQSVIFTACVDSLTGDRFCEFALAPALEAAKPDIVIVDPALSYLGGEANQQKDVSAFLRNGLNPLLHKHNCGLVLVHHTNKPLQGEQKAGWQAGDFAYLGTGSAEWANWARAVMVVRSLGSHDYFELRAGKRGKRLGWRAEDNETRVFTKIIAHGTVGICWREVTKDEFASASGAEDSSSARLKRHKPGLEEFVAIFPPTFKESARQALLSADQIKNAFHDRGWHKDFYRGLCDEAETIGRIVTVRGDGRGGQVLRGLPAMAAAFETQRREQGSMMEDVPLKSPANARRKRRKPNSS